MTKKLYYLCVLFLALAFCLSVGVCNANSFQQGIREYRQQNMLEQLQERALRITVREGQQFLDVAWPAATLAGRFLGQGLTYVRASIIDGAYAEEGYEVTTRIRYLNLLGIEHYLDLKLHYDKRGQETGITFAGYSDELSPMPPRIMSPKALLNRIK